MVQSIIAVVIIVAALIAAIILAVRKVKRLKQPDPCKNCTAACGECAIYKELHKKKNSGNERRRKCS